MRIINDELKLLHDRKNGYSKDVKTNIQKQITVLENRIEKAFQDKLDDNITHEQWKKFNDKWQVEKDKLYIQLEEINKLDKQFYQQADTMLKFTDNAHNLYLQGSLEQRRKIIEIISEKIIYKDKNFDIKLRPVFQTIAENQYKIACVSGSVAESISSFPQNLTNNRTPGKGIKKGLETNSTLKYRKNSDNLSLLELFTIELYNKITDIENFKIITLIESLRKIS